MKWYDFARREIHQDVRELGALLGEVLEAQTSTEAFDTVETIRNSCIDYRRGDSETRDEVHRALNRLNPETQDIVARAFTTYFELINLAEERERVREIRDGSQGDVLATASRKPSGIWPNAELTRRSSSRYSKTFSSSRRSRHTPPKPAGRR